MRPGSLKPSDQRLALRKRLSFVEMLWSKRPSKSLYVLFFSRRVR
jgi:hypothetical protein